MNNKKISFSIIFFIIAFPFTSQAIGIQVSPPKLEIRTTENSSKEVELAIANPTTDVLLFQTYPEDFSNFIKMNPSSFTLEAGGNKRVKVQVLGVGSKIYETNIDILASQLGSEKLGTAAGVRVPITVYVGPSLNRVANESPYYVFFVIALVLLLLYLKFRKK